jgi:hypothetical protein
MRYGKEKKDPLPAGFPPSLKFSGAGKRKAEEIPKTLKKNLRPRTLYSVSTPSDVG